MEENPQEIPQLQEVKPKCPVCSPCPVCNKPKPRQVCLKILALLLTGLTLAFIILAGSGLRVTRKESLLDIWLAGRRGATPTPEAIAPTPTPDPTTDWEVYTNEEYGFEFKYPSEKTAEFMEKPYNGFCNDDKRRGLVNLLLWPEGKKLPVVDEEIGVNDVSFFVYGEENQENLSIEEWVEKNCPQLSGYKKENYEVTDVSAVKYTRIGEGIGSPEIQPYIFLLNNSNLLYIHPYGNKEMFDQVLSTFKFLEQPTEESEIMATEIMTFVGKYMDAYVANDWKEVRSCLADAALEDFTEMDYGIVKYEIVSLNGPDKEGRYHVKVRCFNEAGVMKNPEGDPTLMVFKEGEAWKTLTWYLFQ